jgi:hypothetical protein
MPSTMLRLMARPNPLPEVRVEKRGSKMPIEVFRRHTVAVSHGR